MIITFNINTIDVNSSNPERITKSAHFIFEAGFFIFRLRKHENGNSVTEIYLEHFDMEVVDIMNQNLINSVVKSLWTN